MYGNAQNRAGVVLLLELGIVANSSIDVSLKRDVLLLWANATPLDLDCSWRTRVKGVGTVPTTRIRHLYSEMNGFCAERPQDGRERVESSNPTTTAMKIRPMVASRSIAESEWAFFTGLPHR